jgi:hypothetical protein
MDTPESCAKKEVHGFHNCTGHNLSQNGNRENIDVYGSRTDRNYLGGGSTSGLAVFYNRLYSTVTVFARGDLMY